MAKCVYAGDGSVCGRDTIALSRFCSIHAERGAPESVLSPDPGPRESGKRRLEEAAAPISPKSDRDILL